jgi:hypothetical protein
MTIYATFSEAGFVRSFLHLADGEPAPEGAVPLTEEQFADLVEYQGLRRWTGTRIEVIEPLRPPAVMSVSAAQAKTALYNHGLLDDVEAIVAGHPYRPVKIFFESANEWEKANPYVRAIGAELGLITFEADGTENAMRFDILFDEASKL